MICQQLAFQTFRDFFASFVMFMYEFKCQEKHPLIWCHSTIHICLRIRKLKH